MSAAVAQRNTHHLGPQPPSRTESPMDSKRATVKSEDKQTKESPKVPNGDAVSSKKSNVPTIVNDSSAAAAAADSKPAKADADSAAPLAPPPKPNEGGDYFSGNHNGNNSHNLSEQNPFDSAFGNTGKLPETPGGTQLPPVASLTSPAAQLTGNSGSTFNWGNSLRSGPLSPAMLSGPAGEDYFSTNVGGLGRGFPTPNESSLRTGLTPGGGGSMFPPAPSPNTQAMFSQLGGFQTPGTLEFQRTALNANNVKKEPFTASTQTSQAPTTQASTAAANPSATTATASSQNFDQHDAANGLFMLAHSESQPNNGNFSLQNQAAQERKNRAANGSVSNVSDATAGRSSAPSEEADQKPNTRNKINKKSSSKNVRKAEEVAPAKAPAKKKGKTSSITSVNQFEQDDEDSDDMEDLDENGEPRDPKKMTDEEKRKNFLERNRVAALKCRQRKKQWLANLQAKVEIFTSENDALTAQVTQLREEVLNLKTILIAHKDCPIAQQQANMGQYIPSHHPEYGQHPGPYGQFGPPGPGQIPNMANGGPRRYS